mgnify:CR=1 FL=1
MKRSKVKGKKFDGDKPMVDLLDPEWLLEVSQVLTHGAKKYGLYNWQNRLERRRILAAALRHIIAYWKGEKIDKDSGLQHLAHASCCIMFLAWYERKKK